jgi:hypothetical protein
MGWRANAYDIFFRKPGDHLKDLGVDAEYYENAPKINILEDVSWILHVHEM